MLVSIIAAHCVTERFIHAYLPHELYSNVIIIHMLLIRSKSEVEFGAKWEHSRVDTDVEDENQIAVSKRYVERGHRSNERNAICGDMS